VSARRKALVAGVVACGLASACAPRAPRDSQPIGPELMCSARAKSAEPALPPPPATCGAALAPRLAALKRDLTSRWLPPSYREGELAQVQLQFELDAGGRPIRICVLGGTGDAEARAALQALASYAPLTPLSAPEQCALGQPLVSTFSSELDTPRRWEP